MAFDPLSDAQALDAQLTSTGTRGYVMLNNNFSRGLDLIWRDRAGKVVSKEVAQARLDGLDTLKAHGRPGTNSYVVAAIATRAYLLAICPPGQPAPAEAPYELSQDPAGRWLVGNLKE